MPTLDFDAFLAEQEHEPVELKLGGKVFSLPYSLPAPLALHLLRLNTGRDPTVTVPPEEIEEVSRGLLGKHYDEILGLLPGGIEDLSELLTRLLTMYAPPDTTVPNRAARRAKRPSGSRS